MSLKKFVVIPLLIAVLAFCIQLIDQHLLGPIMPPKPNGGFCWIAFQAWAVYFFAGSTLQGGVKSLIGYAIGIGGAILILTLCTYTDPLGFFNVAVPVAVVACALIFLERTPWWSSFIPAMFVGAGAFFGFTNIFPNGSLGELALTEFVYCALGLFFGFMTVALRTAYEKRIK